MKKEFMTKQEAGLYRRIKNTKELFDKCKELGIISIEEKEKANLCLLELLSRMEEKKWRSHSH